jgi:hypothetical protein
MAKELHRKVGGPRGGFVYFVMASPKMRVRDKDKTAWQHIMEADD